MISKRRPKVLVVISLACLIAFSSLLHVPVGRNLLLAGRKPEKKSKPEQGFISLFDGKSLKGWIIMNGGKFEAKNGTIKLSGGSGWLRSAEEYDDFILRLEVRWLKPKQDSGIFLRATKEGSNWPKRRYEVQCENSPRIARIFGAPHKRDVPLAAKTLKDSKQWNSYEIRCVKTRCEVKLNGQLVTTSDGFKRLKGYIGLQGERGHLEFRNIRIKRLKKSDSR